VARKNNIDVVVKGDYQDKDIQRAIRDLQKLEASSKGFGAQFARVGKQFQDVGKQVSAVGGSLTKNVTLPIVAGGAALVAFAKGAEDAEIANRKLGAVLDSMGYPEATQRVSEYAESLERSLAIDADVIKATQTKLATFKNLTASVGEAGGAFDRATVAALDLAAAGFGSAETNAVQLGKALQDPVKGITALGRAGVTFTEQEREKIKALVESGNLLAAQNIVLGAIEQQVGGTAQAGASAFERMRLSLMQIADAIGMAVLPMIQQLSDYISNTLVPTVVPNIDALVARFTNLDPAIKKATLATIGFAAALGPALIVLGKVIAVVGGVIAVINPLTLQIAAIVGVIAAVVGAFVIFVQRSDMLRNAISTLITTVRNIVTVLGSDLLRVISLVIGQGSIIGQIFNLIARIIGGQLAIAIQAVVRYWNLAVNAVRVVIQVFEIAIRVVTMVANIVRGILLAALDVLLNKLGPVSTALRNLANGVRNAFATAVSAVQAAFNNIGRGIEGFINFAITAVNRMIDAYNKLATVLPGVTRATHIAAFEFKNLNSSGDQAASSANNLANSVGGYASQIMRGNQATDAGVSSFNGLGAAANGAISGLDGVTDALAGSGGGGGGGTAKASDKAAERMEAFKAKFNEVADTLKSRTQEIQNAYNGVIKSVQDAVMGAFDVSNIDPNRVGENGEAVGGTWLDGLASQAEKAVNFANKVAEVVKLGLQPGSAAFETVMGVTKQQGEGLLDELIAGGVDAVNRSIAIVDSVTGAALRVGTDAAEQFYGTGLALAKQTEAAFTKRFGEGGPGYGKLNRMMSALARSMERTTTITVVTRHVSEGIPGRRLGGPVAAGSPYIVGEAGPELFVPTMPGRIIPNHRMSDSMTGRSGAVSMGVTGGSVINLTVNAGMGTNGAEVGRQIVDAISAYEKRNGKLYASA
jgi:phage-related protein